MVGVVIDSSALVEILVEQQTGSRLRGRVLTSELHAPELLAIESIQVLRRMVHHGRLDEPAGRRAVRDVVTAPIALMPHRPLLSRVWELRESVSAYDATYVALAERLGVPLVTCDARLAHSHGHDANVELYPPSSPSGCR